jgi:hypothetical protein
MQRLSPTLAIYILLSTINKINPQLPLLSINSPSFAALSKNNLSASLNPYFIAFSISFGK